MHSSALRALEFDRIVAVVSDLAVTPPGRTQLLALHPLTDARAVAAAQRATTEGTAFLSAHPGFPLRAPADLDDVLGALNVEGRALEPLRLLALSDYLESIERSRAAVVNLREPFPVLRAVVEGVSSFPGEIAAVRRAVEVSGEVADHASPALGSIRERLRRQRTKLRKTLDSFVRGADTAKYLQDQVVTDRNGRYVLMVRAEHRSAIPGIVHGGSASGASLYVEPLETVEINNDIVALEEEEAEEVRRILLMLTDAFRDRPDHFRRTIEVATELDCIQARARFSSIILGIEPTITTDGAFELRGARHPLLIHAVRDRLTWLDNRPQAAEAQSAETPTPASSPVPVDILLVPPVRVLVIAGPNTGGKTVALKTAGLLAAMAQAGLHISADARSRLPIFHSLFADIGDEQSISASLSTFSAHIAHVVAMDRELALPGLVLLDEVGAGTDPAEGGALGMAVIDHFRRRGAHLVATTHYDSLKSYASTTEGVAGAAFGFDPETFAPTYRLLYGSPGRSLALEIAARLGMPAAVVAAARENLGEREQQLADHLARVDDDMRRLEQERRLVARERAAIGQTEAQLRMREMALREREEAFRRKLDARLDEQVRTARREIDAVIDGLKARAAELAEQAARASATITTGDAGAARSAARAAIDQAVDRVKDTVASERTGAAEITPPRSAVPLAPGVTVAVGTLGLKGFVTQLHGKHAEVDVAGKRLRVALRDLRVIEAAPTASRVRIHVELQPREGSTAELNVVGCTVDEAVARAEKFLDASMVADQRTIRLIHGHGTGQLRRALAAVLKTHPLVAHFDAAPPDQGGSGVTVVELKD